MGVFLNNQYFGKLHPRNYDEVRQYMLEPGKVRGRTSYDYRHDFSFTGQVGSIMAADAIFVHGKFCYSGCRRREGIRRGTRYSHAANWLHMSACYLLMQP